MVLYSSQRFAGLLLAKEKESCFSVKVSKMKVMMTNVDMHSVIDVQSPTDNKCSIIALWREISL